MKKMVRGNKKGLSDVVTNVLLVLLVIVAIGIIWAFVYPMIAGAGKKAEAGTTMISLTIPGANVYVNPLLQSASIVVKRESGEGNLKAVKIILEDITGKTFNTRKDVVIDELGSKVIDISYNTSGLGKMKKISVAPVFTDSSGKEATGAIAASYSVEDFNIGRAFKMLPNDMIDINSFNGLPSNAITISLWTKLAEHRNWPNFLNHEWVSGTTDYNWLMLSDSSGMGRFGTSHNNGDQITPGAIFSLNSWHLLTGTFDGTTIIMYIDGVEVGRNVRAGVLDNMGRVYTTGINGSIKDMRVYNVALTQAEVAGLYNGGLGDNAGNIQTDKIVLWWKFDDAAIRPFGKYGDVNGDGIVDLGGDVNGLVDIVLRRVAAPAPGSNQFLVCDLDGNGKLEQADITLLASFINGDIVKFPVEKDYTVKDSSGKGNNGVVTGNPGWVFS